MTDRVRVGLIVPSSNTTMETEIPMMLHRRAALDGTAFTFHSSRVRLKHVTRKELDLMVTDSDRCAIELADARVDVIAYACLVALMTQGPAYFEEAERRLAAVAADHGATAPVVSSAGALVRSLTALGASRIVVLMPYTRPIAETVIGCIEQADFVVQDSIALDVADNLEVGRIDPSRLVAIADRLNRADADAIVLSACVQMPSLPAITQAERQFGLPVVSAATATTFELLTRLGLDPVVPDAGHLLSGKVTPPPLSRPTAGSPDPALR